MNNEKIVVIDDDTTLLELLSDHLTAAGYQAEIASDSVTGLQLAKQGDPSLVILDVMMPEMDGWEVCARLRQVSSVPIIMLTAKDEELDKLRGFHLGVDDYVTKPFSFAELVARVGAILARSAPENGANKRLASGSLVIDFENRRVTVSDKIVDLTPTEYRLLETLASAPGRAIATESLLKNVWGPEYAGELKHVKHYIWSLRKKIESDLGNPHHILTERGFGYRFE